MDNPLVLIHFGKRVRELRQQQGLSQEDLAALCELDRTYISSLERGQRNVGLKNIYALTRALGVSLSQFWEGVAINDPTDNP